MQLPGEGDSKSNYNWSARTLHYLALGIPIVSKASFDLDCIGNNSTHVVKNGHHVFVSGLARSGSTILTRLLYESELFRSLSYRDMPFVLMPKMWNKVIGKSFKAALKKRDFSAKRGTDVMATADGLVVSSRYNGTFGNYIEISHGNGYKTVYGHLRKRFVKKGTYVVRGQKIGEVGSTGKSTAPHLHYEVKHHRKRLDPKDFYFNNI